QRQKVSIEGDVQPGGGLCRRSGRGKRILQIISRRTNLSALSITNDPAVDEKTKKQRAPAKRKDIQRLQLFSRNERLAGLEQQRVNAFENIVCFVGSLFALKEGAMHETLKKQRRLPVLLGNRLHRYPTNWVWAK